MLNRHEDQDWIGHLTLMRKEKDEWMRGSPNSPLPLEKRHHFKGLGYFPPDAEYRLPANLHAYPEPRKLAMSTSKGEGREYLRYGYFEFEVEGSKQTLQAYRSVKSRENPHEDEGLFIPFRDLTSGNESYGAARYLDLEYNPSGEYILDFNLAYNPNCAYSDNYICPFPPPENWLKIPIRAGEKNFHRRGL